MAGYDFVIGDQVICFKSFGSVKARTRGMILKHALDPDEPSHLCVQFVGRSGGEPDNVPVSHLEHAPLCQDSLVAKGDAVVAAVAFESVTIGTPGVVVGPWSAPGLDNISSRLLVDFGDKGRYNYSRSQINYADLLDTFQKEDRITVVVPLNEKDGINVSKGARGVVVGRAKRRDQTTCLRAQIDDTWFVDIPTASIAHAEIVPNSGIKKFDRVKSLLKYNTIEIGDPGTAIGGANTKMKNASERVCICWDNNKGTSNWVPGKQIVKVDAEDLRGPASPSAESESAPPVAPIVAEDI